MLKGLLGIEDTQSDSTLGVFLSFTKSEILNWMYHLVGGIPTDVTNVPTQYETVQIMACVAGFNQMGAENQTSHHENGYIRDFKWSDAVQYIHENVLPYARY